MARQIEATQAWIESLAYQMLKMPKHIQDARLGGAFALCKLQCSRTFEFCAREASQILGGIAYTKVGLLVRLLARPTNAITHTRIRFLRAAKEDA